ncbi:Phosphopantothenoylcysteine decarboxylase [Rubripirellula tenax]|uniref:Phosphopantothenoylcysteine decarboxylase n=1 Tax=Rubripirellula tenax TaxID=2528015 RepID=A0A5C6FAN8_9BACT|nr:flavoprotein [Rubripirellula tenax]TWU58863.1 Phosphopantothenoylcysteine decarboxylase [Rubripirellula tenax]
MKSRQTVLLAIGGGIAAYKSAILCSRLAQAGFEVRVALTGAAAAFIGAPTFAALSSRPVASEMFDSRFPLGPHIELADGADLMVIAPATANLLSKFANGAADDLVSTLYLQVACPVLLAPAMSAAMWSKPSVRRNVVRLEEDGCHFAGPETGWLSCRVSGEGRMAEPESILVAAEKLLDKNNSV